MIGSNKDNVNSAAGTAGSTPEKVETTPKERVQLELKDLKEKILKLTAVLFGDNLMEKDIDTDMLILMEQQLHVMQTYAAILQNRLAHWERPVANTFYHPYKAPGCGC